MGTNTFLHQAPEVCEKGPLPSLQAPHTLKLTVAATGEFDSDSLAIRKLLVPRSICQRWFQYCLLASGFDSDWLSQTRQTHSIVLKVTALVSFAEALLREQVYSVVEGVSGVRLSQSSPHLCSTLPRHMVRFDMSKTGTLNVFPYGAEGLGQVCNRGIL